MSGSNICEFCNKPFSKKSNLVKHQNICKQKETIDIIKQKDDIIKSKDIELKQKEDHINLLKSMLDKYIDKPNIINNNNSNNNVNSNTTNNLTIKHLVSKLEPINFQDVKEHMENYSNKYKDKGTTGFAQFLCDYPFKDKFITSNFSRNTIVYKTRDQNFIRDPESIHLLNQSIKENKDEVIEKAIERLEYINKKLKNYQDGDEFVEYVIKKSKLKKLICLAEDISTCQINDKEASSVFRNRGMHTYQDITKGDENNNEIEEERVLDEE
jgi:hypothetical protein